MLKPNSSKKGAAESLKPGSLLTIPVQHSWRPVFTVSQTSTWVQRLFSPSHKGLTEFPLAPSQNLEYLIPTFVAPWPFFPGKNSKSSIFRLQEWSCGSLSPKLENPPPCSCTASSKTTEESQRVNDFCFQDGAPRLPQSRSTGSPRSLPG